MDNCKKKCDKKDCFEITNETYHLCIKKETELNFDADMGYVGGNMSYTPLTEKPEINYKVLQSGNNSLDYLGIQEEITDISEQDIDNIIFGG